MFDMVTPTYKSIIASIDNDIERLNAALAIVSDIRANKRRDNDDRLESAIRGIGGEIAWLQSKKLEAEKYLSEGE